MKILNNLLGFFMIGVTSLTFLVPGAKNFQQPELARILFFHVPCALISVLFLVASAWFSYRYLREREHSWDVRSAACLESSWLLAVLTLATGMLFSKVQWGAWWQWDPRQTSYLLLLFLLSAGLLLRRNIAGRSHRATASSAYTIATLLPTLFLVFVFPRLPHIQSFHPSQTLLKGELDIVYSWVLRSTGIMLFWACVLIYRLRVKIELLETKIEDNYDHRDLENRRYATPIDGVARSVSLYKKN